MLARLPRDGSRPPISRVLTVCSVRVLLVVLRVRVQRESVPEAPQEGEQSYEDHPCDDREPDGFEHQLVDHFVFALGLGKKKEPHDISLPSAPAYSGGMSALLSVVVPMFNEADALPLLVPRLRQVLDDMVDHGLLEAKNPYEVLAIDDGSTDQTPVLLQRFHREWPQLRVIRLRANAGHQSAISAGLDLATGGWVITLDADLQDPPEAIPLMVQQARSQAVDVVYGVRTDRSSDSAFKRLSARAFYAGMRVAGARHAPDDAGDYRLMSRATVDAVNALPQTHRVLRLVVPSLGFPSSTVGYTRAKRAAGRSKYPLPTMMRMSVDAFTGFSLAPLRIATWFGLGGFAASLLLLAYAVVSKLLNLTVAGWTSTVVIVAAVGALQLLCLGILGEYVGRIYSTLQRRPAYYIAYDSIAGDVDWQSGHSAEALSTLQPRDIAAEGPEKQA